tara:strand:+ start:1827 stop:2054 length:228 start_codon:yes stop_codon:yes gene_type:complete
MDVRNCPVNERTAEGKSVGRCWFYCPEGICPRHGDVSSAIAKFKETGKLTDENDIPRKPVETPEKTFLQKIFRKK